MTDADAPLPPDLGPVMAVVKSGVPAPEATVEALQSLASGRRGSALARGRTRLLDAAPETRRVASRPDLAPRLPQPSVDVASGVSLADDRLVADGLVRQAREPTIAFAAWPRPLLGASRSASSLWQSCDRRRTDGKAIVRATGFYLVLDRKHHSRARTARHRRDP